MKSSCVQPAVLEPLEARCLLDGAGGPTAAIVSMPSVGFNDKYLTVVVKYTDASVVNRATISYGNIVLTGPGGYSHIATDRSAVVNSNSTIITATYTFQAPEVAWGAADNGQYTITLQANQVFDMASNATPATVLGTETVAITNQNIYISPTGLTTNKGTADSPWPSVNYALSQSGGRKTFILMPGTYPVTDSYYHSAIYIPTCYEGTAAYPTVLQSQYKWQAIIDAGGQVDEGICTGGDAEYIVIDGFVTENANVDGIKLDGDNDIVRNCWTHDNAFGISSHGHNFVLIENNLIEHNGYDTHYEHGIYADGQGLIICGNIVRYNSAFGIHMYPDITDSLIYNNLVYGQSNQAGIVLESTDFGNNMVVNNTILDNATGIETFGNPIGKAQSNIITKGIDVSALDAITSNNIADYVAVAPDLFNLASSQPTLPSSSVTVDTVAPAITVDTFTTKAISPRLTGTVDDPSATIVVTVNGHTYTAANNGDGTWDLVAATIPNLPGGAYTVTATATDPTGNVGTASGELTIDLMAPIITVNTLTTKVVSPALTGTVDDPSAIIAVTVNGRTYSAVNNGNGTWTLAAGKITNLSGGTYSVTATATDTVGNVGTDSTSNELTIDLTAPIVTVNTLTTKVISPALTGTINDPTATVAVTVNGHTYSAANNDNGTWILAAGTIANLSAGTYSVTATATDAAGNTGTDATANELIIDLTNPAVTVNTLATGSASPALTGTVNDPSAIIAVTVNGHTYAATNNGNGTWTLAAGTIVNLSGGTYSVTATATDIAGNVGTDATSNELTIDLTAPIVAIGTLTTKVTSPALAGTVNDATATVAVTVNGCTYTAKNNGNGTWTLAAGKIAKLPGGSYGVIVTATDPVGNVGTYVTSNELIIDLTAPTVTVNALATNVVSPALTGTINDPAATVAVTINSHTYAATNNGNGTWTLAAGKIASLHGGTYSITAKATDAAGNIGKDATAYELVIDQTAPVVTVGTVISGIASPSLTGRINDPTATVAVTVNGHTYAAINNGNGTWTLAVGKIANLPNGTYNVTATATDAAGNIGTDTTTNELTVELAVSGVDSTQSVVLGISSYKVVYVDADGTTVTISSGKGDVAVNLTGVGVTTTTSSRTKTVTVAGAITKVDLEVAENTSTLAIKTDAKGDGLTSIDQITGSGTLGKLSGAKVDLIGGIDMTTGVIKSINLHSIRSDITMAKLDTGVGITAGVIENSTIDTDIIKSLKAVTSFRNTSVSATTIGTVRLSNVDTDNGGTPFGINATTIASLKIKQGRTWQTWGKNFTSGIDDFAVTV